MFLPAAFLLAWFSCAALAWLALFGLVVPAAILEGRGPGAALRRSVEVARGPTIVHAIGGLATLVLLVWHHAAARCCRCCTRSSRTTPRAPRILLAGLVLSPVLFFGAALLFVDQAARVGTTREAQTGGSSSSPDAPPPAR